MAFLASASCVKVFRSTRKGYELSGLALVAIVRVW